MSNNKGSKIVLAARPNGKPLNSDFRLENFDIPEPASGQILLRTQFLSVDPYMRGRMDDKKSYAQPVAIGGVMGGDAVAEVVDSKNDGFSVGDIVLVNSGWQTHYVSNGQGLRKLNSKDAPTSTALGVLGMPGFTAYGGMKVIGQAKAGETVVVAAASGPVGSLVGQIAMMNGARAVGIAGGAQKCKYVKEELGFDVALDHKASDFAKELAAACPGGIDVYFENVGGHVWQAVRPLLNKFARIPVCGLIAQYNGATFTDKDNNVDSLFREILSKSLLFRGFINVEFSELYPDFLKEIGAGIRDGKIKYSEEFVDGLENAPEALIGMLEGKNNGKVVIRV